jgi:hypothetical protein
MSTPLGVEIELTAYLDPLIRVLFTNPFQKFPHARLVPQAFQTVVFVTELLVGE